MNQERSLVCRDIKRRELLNTKPGLRRRTKRWLAAFHRNRSKLPTPSEERQIQSIEAREKALKRKLSKLPGTVRRRRRVHADALVPEQLAQRDAGEHTEADDQGKTERGGGAWLLPT